MTFSPARTLPGVTVLPVISTSAIGSITTVSDAVLLALLGSPSKVLVTVAVLTKLPAASGRLTTTSMVTVSPGAKMPPPAWLQVTVAPDAAQLKMAVLPAVTTGLKAPKVVRPAMNPGTLSVNRTPVAPSLPGLRLLTTSL
ncbi:MAG: hypothetical protein QE285_12650 [Aquabacterium sp.]|nr:hypothetical protein [Aquabacterium sp.]